MKEYDKIMSASELASKIACDISHQEEKELLDELFKLLDERDSPKDEYIESLKQTQLYIDYWVKRGHHPILMIKDKERLEDIINNISINARIDIIKKRLVELSNNPLCDVSFLEKVIKGEL
jgi:hypothetical protein